MASEGRQNRAAVIPGFGNRRIELDRGTEGLDGVRGPVQALQDKPEIVERRIRLRAHLGGARR